MCGNTNDDGDGNTNDDGNGNVDDQGGVKGAWEGFGCHHWLFPGVKFQIS